MEAFAKMSSMIELVKELSRKSLHEECVMTRKQYQSMMSELHSQDEFLQKKYLHYSSIPQILSLYGVKITIIEPVKRKYK